MINNMKIEKRNKADILYMAKADILYTTKAVYAIICVLCVIAGIAICRTDTYAAGQIEEISPDSYYGRQALKQLKNGDNYLYVYDKIAKGIENHETKISVSDAAHSISVSEIKMVFEAYCNDYPQHFWRNNTIGYEYLGTTVLFVMPEYNISKTQYIAEKAKFENNIQQIVSDIDVSMSEFDRELEVHDRLAKIITYDDSTSHAHDAYGAVIEGKAVCEGYARAFQYLLYKVGIQSMVVTGYAKELHAWNLVRIDGEYYYTDLTWDDQNEYIFHAYFNLSLAEMKKDHTLDVMINLPQCTSTKANYFKMTGTMMDTYSIDNISNALKKSDRADMYFTCDTTGLGNWYMNNIDKIVSKTDIQGDYKYGYNHLGNEWIFRLEGARPESNQQMQTSGNIAIGDVNEDGTVDIKDSSLLKRYLAGWSVIINISAADINGDDEINIKDSAVLKRYLAGWNVNLESGLKYEMKELQIDIKTSTGKIAAVENFTYPVFVSSGIVAEKLNAYYEELIDLFTLQEEEADFLYRDFDSKNIQMPVGDKIESEVCYNKNGKISVCIRYVGQTLFGSDATVIECKNYDILTGEEIELDDIVKGSDKSKEKLYQNYLEQYYEKGTVQQLINSNFCMKEEGISLFYYVEENEEYVEIFIPYTSESENSITVL